MIEHHTQKLSGILVNNNRIVNNITCDWGKVTKSAPNRKWSICGINKLRAFLFYIYGMHGSPTYQWYVREGERFQ